MPPVSWCRILAPFILVAGLSSTADAATYERGYHALQIWDETAMNTVPWVMDMWLKFMLAVFAAGLFFIWRHPIARWLVGGFVVVALVFVFVIPALGLVPLSGLAALTHVIFWSPGLYLLLKHRPFFGRYRGRV